MMMLLNLARLAALAFAASLAACTVPTPPGRGEMITFTSSGSPTISPAWSQVIMMSTVARIEWVDLDWEHSEQGAGYWRVRKGAPIDIVVTLKDGKASKHTIKTGAYVSVARDELRLP